MAFDSNEFKKFEATDFQINGVKFSCKKLNAFQGANFLKVLIGKELLSDGLKEIEYYLNSNNGDITPIMLITFISNIDIVFLENSIFPVIFENTLVSYHNKSGIDIKPQPLTICKEEVGIMIEAIDIYELCFRFIMINFFSSLNKKLSLLNQK